MPKDLTPQQFHALFHLFKTLEIDYCDYNTIGMLTPGELNTYLEWLVRNGEA
ncbi:MAG: hypothetical protein H6765_11295 [Candidatus Peribacteria bacterium]|nr:MAG: hypothetical protein H6765_11295 [Candidatus Peribacteria bacterium]